MLKKQITPSGKYVIYQYARYGAAFTSDIVGSRLISIEDSFSEYNGVQFNYDIIQWVSEDTLVAYNCKRDEKNEIVGNFVVRNYFSKKNHVDLFQESIDSVWTTSDSIFLRVIVDDNSKKVISFQLGGVTVKSIQDSIKVIEIKAIFEEKWCYLYRRRDGNFSESMNNVGLITFEFIPIRKITTRGLYPKKIFYEEL